ncbi:phospholipase A2 homolog ECS_00014-like [Physella acuta]|uniref:phospholipase A2 homolog ECS_00014-like n=1 Tax=Physella acuta TaxID=109671 RepID=UPI0027DD3327|nr:phospholipase A2 homolog ECS_00014-like [Physella acuta]
MNRLSFNLIFLVLAYSGFENIRSAWINTCLVINEYTNDSCSKFYKYGCNCVLNRMGIPVDELDHCCVRHSECYGKQKCSVEVVTPVKCANGSCSCTEHDISSCSYTGCLCDIRLGRCLKKFLNTYNNDSVELSSRWCRELTHKVQKGLEEGH